MVYEILFCSNFADILDKAGRKLRRTQVNAKHCVFHTKAIYCASSANTIHTLNYATSLVAGLGESSQTPGLAKRNLGLISLFHST